MTRDRRYSWINRGQENKKIYIIESNRIIREVKIVRCSGGIFLVKFPDTGGGIQVKRHRLFATREEAGNSIAKPIEKKKTNPYKYWH